MKNKGFTLVELAVTLSIIIILMSVSVPIYRSNLTNYKKAEGYALLASIRSAQEKYYSEYGNFLCGSDGSGGVKTSYISSTSNEEVLGINARTNKYYTVFSINGYNLSGAYFICDSTNNRYSFGSFVSGKNGTLRMWYNITSGVTIQWYFSEIKISDRGGTIT